MVKPKMWINQKRNNGSVGSGAVAMKRFTAPTPGLKDVIFTWGTVKDAARFEDTVSSLARFVGTQYWKFSSMASKAMSTLSAPDIKTPICPVREYWTNNRRYEKT